MSVKEKVSLEKRLELLKAGYASTPEYYPCIIKKLAEIPLELYLKGFEQDLERLMALLGYMPIAGGKMTYGQAAARIARINPKDVRDSARLEEALQILSAPMVHNFKMREERRAKANG